MSSLRGDGAQDLAWAVTVGYLTGGVLLTLGLQWRGHRQMCAVLRSPAGFVAWLVFTLHLWVRRFDPVHVIAGRRR